EGDLPAARRLDSLLGPQHPDHLVDRDQASQTLELDAPQRPPLEVVLGQLLRRLAHDDAVRCGESLEARGPRDSFPHCQVAPRFAADLPDEHHAGIDADPGLQGAVVPSAEPFDRLDQLQGGGHSPPPGVLVRPGVSEVHQHAVTERLRDVPPVALDDGFALAMVLTQELVKAFGPDERELLRRPDEIAENDRDLALLLARRQVSPSRTETLSRVDLDPVALQCGRRWARLWCRSTRSTRPACRRVRRRDRSTSRSRRRSRAASMPASSAPPSRRPPESIRSRAPAWRPARRSNSATTGRSSSASSSIR